MCLYASDSEFRRRDDLPGGVMREEQERRCESEALKLPVVIDYFIFND